MENHRYEIGSCDPLQILRHFTASIPCVQKKNLQSSCKSMICGQTKLEKFSSYRRYFPQDTHLQNITNPSLRSRAMVYSHNQICSKCIINFVCLFSAFLVEHLIDLRRKTLVDSPLQYKRCTAVKYWL